jgi:hypothetical protein
MPLSELVQFNMSDIAKNYLLHLDSKVFFAQNDMFCDIKPYLIYFQNLSPSPFSYILLSLAPDRLQQISHELWSGP